MIKLLTLVFATFLASAVHAQSCVKSLRSLSSCGNSTFRYGQVTCGNGRTITVYNSSFSCMSEAALAQLGDQKCVQSNFCGAPVVLNPGGPIVSTPVAPIVYNSDAPTTTFVSKPSSITVSGNLATVIYSDIHCGASGGYQESFTRKINLDLNNAGNANFVNALSASLSSRSSKFEGLSLSCPSQPSFSSFSDLDNNFIRRSEYAFPDYCKVVSLNTAPVAPPINCTIP